MQDLRTLRIVRMPAHSAKSNRECTQTNDSYRAEGYSTARRTQNRRGKPTEKGGQTDKGDPANEVV